MFPSSMYERAIFIAELFFSANNYQIDDDNENYYSENNIISELNNYKKSYFPRVIKRTLLVKKTTSFKTGTTTRLPVVSPIEKPLCTSTTSLSLSLSPNPNSNPNEMGWLARFTAAVAFLAVGVVFAPEKVGGAQSSGVTSAARLAHLLCFATSWGAALWVTFIGGIIMFKHLPRHQFGNLQGKMFPAYFSVISVCAAVCVAAFAYLHPWKSASQLERYQLGFLLSSLGFNLSNLLVFTPMTVEMMKKRHKIERELKIGEEVGWSKNVETAKKNPNLAAMNKKFGMIHGLSSLANIMSFGCLAIHSWYLAGKTEL